MKWAADGVVRGEMGRALEITYDCSDLYLSPASSVFVWESDPDSPALTSSWTSSLLFVIIGNKKSTLHHLYCLEMMGWPVSLRRRVEAGQLGGLVGLPELGELRELREL